ncbi:hypothetical protein HBH70_236810 [Parastagonospora nodorum]|nr:hypothetical protein HBH43_206270 [Parastagonospora nodorum]KAH4199799.1 hypothetical protein HBH42_035860 [Parastagonospora nodorum]KAH4844252.1 hypothetical protein HBH75_195860 [Parastagonospora nodorum]KAH5121044.1 hypothetical protein HBH71_068020 [Parastagonospora nodorum]KAH5126614.1 hypothetical protein HBH70_236810 [Parastagonospora nodorum]
MPDDEASDPDAVLEAETILEAEVSLNEKLSLTDNEKPLDDELSTEDVADDDSLPPKPKPREFGSTVGLALMINESIDETSVAELKSDELPPEKIGKPPGYPSSQGSDK